MFQPNRTIRATAFIMACVFVPLRAHAQENTVSKDLGTTAYDAGMAALKILQDPTMPVDRPKMYKAASMAFAKGVEQGNTNCANELGKLYLQGNGVEWDPYKAQALFQQSADGGNIRGMTNLGMMYKGYRGIPQDWEKAAEWLIKAADGGQPLAQCELAFMYNLGAGVERDQTKAFALYSKAAEQGFAKGQYGVGHHYLFGSKDIEKDPKKALEWFQKAAQSNDPQIRADIAGWLLDETGDIYDPDAAALILPEAAKAGNRDAQYYLGTLYYDGYGVAKDNAIAFRLLNASAGQGDARALCDIAGMYLRGEGTEKNPQAAYVCAEMADDGGWPFAILEREEAIKLMTPEQLEQAKAAVERQKAANAQRRAEQEKLNPKPQQK